MATGPLTRLRTLCLGLPEAAERETWDLPTFRVRGKIFAMVPGAGRDLAVWCKAPPGAQQVLVSADPDRFFAPPYLGPKGWIGIRLHPPPDWTEVAELVRRSYRLVAPKRLAVQVG
jgi:predicted DNA-binding protein (MmcQ/YjbR family)